MELKKLYIKKNPARFQLENKSAQLGSARAGKFQLGLITTNEIYQRIFFLKIKQLSRGCTDSRVKQLAPNTKCLLQINRDKKGSKENLNGQWKSCLTLLSSRKKKSWSRKMEIFAKTCFRQMVIIVLRH